MAPPPVLLLRSVRTEPGWFWKPSKVVMTGPTSEGHLRQLTYRAHQPWQAHVMADSALFQSSRWWWVREGAEVLAGYVVLRAIEEVVR